MLLPERSIEKLDQSHQIETFDCGVPELNYFLVNYALLNQRANSTKTYVGCEDKKVIGYYSLAVGSVIHTRTPERVTKGLAKHPVPVMLLARLAVDKKYQSLGIGKGLLKNALLKTVQAADIAGIRALLVHAKDETAKNWYQSLDFEESPTDPLHLFLLIKDIKSTVYQTAKAS